MVCNATFHISCEISGSHGDKYEDECLLGYSACSLFGVDRRFRDVYCLHPHFSLGVDRGLKGTFHYEGGDGGSTHVGNLGLLQRDYTALYSRSLFSSSHSLLKLTCYLCQTEW
jgi:hypothetical protein